MWYVGNLKLEDEYDSDSDSEYIPFENDLFNDEVSLDIRHIEIEKIDISNEMKHICNNEN